MYDHGWYWQLRVHIKMIVKLQVMIKLFIRAACISFLYNCGTLALRGTSLPSRVTSLHSAQLLRSLASTRLQGRRTPDNCGYSRYHRLLLHTALDARETFDDNVVGPRTVLSTSTDKAALVLSDFHVITRVDAVDKIRHVELYLRRRKGGNFTE